MYELYELLIKSFFIQIICNCGNVEMLRYVVEEKVKISDKEIFDVLSSSEDIWKNKNIVSILVDHIDDVNYKADSDESFLYIACQDGSAPTVQKLLDRGASIGNDVGYLDPLEAASSRGHADVLNLLLNWCTSKQVPISKGRLERALISAADLGNVAAMKCLIAFGVDPDTLNAVLRMAVSSDQQEAAACLLDHGADANAPTGQLNSAMTIACGDNRLADMLLVLLSRGGDPNGLDTDGNSPLNYALFSMKATAMLLEHGADPDTPFPNGSTPLLDVVLSSAIDIDYISLLLEHHADPNLAHLDTGVTALMISAVNNKTDYVRLLLEHGADVTQLNRDGQTVLDLLDEEKYSELYNLCTQYIDINKPGAKLLLK